MIEHKIVILGSMGAGKSTLVRTVANDRVVDTDVDNTDAASEKLATTVAMDYADVALPNGDRIRLFGTPGQARFSFIWPILLEGAAGAVVLLDASGAEPAAELDRYLDVLGEHAPAVPVAIGLTKLDLADATVAQRLAAHVGTRGQAVPLVPVDARVAGDILMLMDILMIQIDTADLVATHG
ncbi:MULTISPECIES: GTP-binding protein [unclassified Luteimonas]